MSVPKLRWETVAVMLIVGVIGGWSVVHYFEAAYYLERYNSISRVTGYTAVGFLLATLILRPIARLLQRFPISIEPERETRFVRHLGFACAAFAVAHGVFSLATYFDWKWQALYELTFLRSGAVALAIVVVLALVSFRPAMRLIGARVRKATYRMSLVAALLVLHHVLLAPFAPQWLTLVLFGGAFLVVLVDGVARTVGSMWQSFGKGE